MPVFVRDDFDRFGNGAAYYDPGLTGLGFASATPPPGVIGICCAPNLTALPTQGYAHGFLGLVFTGLPPDTFPSGSAAIGVTCLLSDADFSDTGTGYFLEWHPVNGNLVFGKMTAGLPGRTVLDSRVVFAVGGQIALNWLVDPYNASWVHFRIFAGGSRIYQYQDFFSPLYTTGIREGFYYESGGSGAFTFAYLSAVLGAEV